MWAAGYYFQSNLLRPLYLHWDGATGTQVPSPSSGGTIVCGLAPVSPDDLWSLGIQAAHQPFSTLPFAEHWDGLSWTPVRPAPIPGKGDRQFAGGTAVATDDVWAVGYGENRGDGDAITAIEHWDGSFWSFVKAPQDGTMLSAYALSANNIWTVGYQAHLGNSRASSEHWDGAAWTALPTPNPGGRDSLLSGVTAISSTDIWAVGENIDQVGALVPLAMHSSGAC